MSNNQLRNIGIVFASGIIYVIFVPALLGGLTNINASWWLILGFVLWGLSIWLFTVKLPKDIANSENTERLEGKDENTR